VAYPQSTVPYFIVLGAFVVDLLYEYAFKKNPKSIGWFLISISIVSCVYLVSLINPDFPFHPPMPAVSVFAAFFSTLFGYGIASLLLHLYEYYTAHKEIFNKALFTRGHWTKL
jgi:hypothetical protein